MQTKSTCLRLFVGMMYAALGPVDAGCRLAGGGHGVLSVDYARSPPGTTASVDACLAYCTTRDACLAIEWETPEGSFGPKCEIWWTMPAYGEGKPHHECRIKLRAVPPPPISPPAPLPSTPPTGSPNHPALILGASVCGGVGALMLLGIVMSCMRKRRKERKGMPSDV